MPEPENFKLLIEGMTEGGMITSWTASRGQLRVGEVAARRQGKGS